MTRETWLSPKEVTNIENCTERSFYRRFRAGFYKTFRYVESPNGGRGGRKLQIGLSCLSDADKAAYYKMVGNTRSQEPGASSDEQDSSKLEVQGQEGSPLLPRAQIVCPGLADWQNRIASARFDLVSEYKKVKEEAAKKKQKARGKGRKKISVCKVAEDFVAAYNTGLTHPDIFKILGKVAKNTLENWWNVLKKSNWDFAALAPHYGEHKKGKRKVTEAEMEQMLRFALTSNQLRPAHVIRWTKKVLAKNNIPSPSSEATLRRALRDWKEHNYDRWVFCRKGEKALDDEVLPYLERDASLLSVGGVLVADGHKLNFQVINPFTGKPGRAVWLVFYDWASRYPAGWYIMFTENIQCIHAALRRAILNLGKIPTAVLLDNGKAFKARVFNDDSIDFKQAGFRGLYARLGIKTFFAWPYNAKAKPIERFFGTFNELERLLPSYVGRSIEDKPAYLKRNEKLHKKLHNPFVPTIDQAATIIQAWIDEEYAKRPHRGLNGAYPADIWKPGKGPGVDEGGLRYLMMNHEIKSIHRNGITMFGINYYDEALYGYRRKVLVKYDILDMEQIYVYTEDGRDFLCEARPMRKVHPVARLTGNPLDLETLRQESKRRGRLKKSTEMEARQAAAEIGPWNFPEVQGLETKLTRAEIEHIEKEASQVKVISLNDRRQPDLASWSGEVYERLLEKRARGEELTTDEMVMMRAFEQTREYEMLKEYYQEFEERLILAAESGMEGNQ